MNTLKVSIQLGCLVLLTAIVVLLARKEHHNLPVVTTEPQKSIWKYSSFEFNSPRISEGGRHLNASLVYYDLTDDQTLTTQPVRTNRVSSADEVLGETSRDGWQFVWTNGTNYLMRRAESEGRHAYFIVEYLPETP